MNWNVLGLISSLNQNAGLNPDTYVCYAPMADSSAMCNAYGNDGTGSGSNVPIVTPSLMPPATVNPAPPINPVITDPVQSAPNVSVNLLPVVNPGSIMTVPAPLSIPVTPTATTPAHIANSNPWLIGLLLAGGVYIISKKKKGK